MEIKRKGINMIKVGTPTRYCKEETAMEEVAVVCTEWILMTYLLCSWAEAWAVAVAVAIAVGAEAAVACLEASTWANNKLAKALPSNSDERFRISLHIIV